MPKSLLIEALEVVRSKSKLTESESAHLPHYIREGVGNKVVLRVPATTLDVRNQNNRTYSTNMFEKVLGSKEMKEAFSSRKLFSTVDDHPESPYVAPGNASHVVTRAWCENGFLMNEWLILETAKGKDLKALVDSDASFGVSIRGLGSEDSQGNILEDYEYLGTDCVGNPSAKLWVRPQPVTESINESTKDPNAMSNKTFTTAAAVLAHLGEQKRLLMTDDPRSAFERASAIETSIPRLVENLSRRDSTDVFNYWDKVKEELLPSKSVTESDSTKALSTQNSTLRNQLRSASKIFRKEMIDALTANKRLMTQLAEANRQITSLKEAAVKSENRYSGLKKLYRSGLVERANTRIKYGIAVTEAAVARTSYKVAVSEAAKARRVGKTAGATQSTTAAVTESTKPSNVATLTPASSTNVAKVARGVGDHQVPNWI